MKNQDMGCRMQDSAEGFSGGFYPESRIPNPALLQRVRWRCRRGLLELDIVFERFVKAHYASLSEPERQTFEEFLDMADNPLWDLISGKTDAVTDAQRTLLLKINSL